MTAFDEAFTLLKVEHAFDLMEGHLLQKGKMDEAMELQAMREFVNVNAESADPAKRQAAEEMLRQLTELMSRRRPDPVQIPPSPVGEGGIPTASTEHPAVEKAFDFLRKNVVGIQDGVEYKMPESIASMAQRPQVPEFMEQTMKIPTRAPGMFGRFKPPVMRTRMEDIPTGQLALGGPQTMNVQENPQLPFQSPLEQQLPAGAKVTRMPRPGPYAEDDDPTGMEHNILTDRNFGTISHGTVGEGNPMGTKAPRVFYQAGGKHTPDGKFMTQADYQQQMLYGDQFNPNRQFNPTGA
tara:strand:+ start:2965 stop:3849 length:885 start_codon:yes stop_codon:yes gene_type:complete